MAKKMAKTPSTEDVEDGGGVAVEEVAPKDSQGQLLLGDWLFRLPDDLQEAVDEYVKTMRAANKAREKMNSAKDRCKNKMLEHEVERVRIDEGGKWLHCKEDHKLVTETIKEPEA